MGVIHLLCRASLDRCRRVALYAVAAGGERQTAASAQPIPKRLGLMVALKQAGEENVLNRVLAL